MASSRPKGKYKDYDQIMEALEARRDLELRWAQLHAQRYCYDAPDSMDYPWPGAPLARDTEVLLQTGWKRVDQIKIGEIALTRRDEDGQLEWAPVEATPSVFAKALYHFKNKSIDQLVTDHHTMVVVKPGGKKARIKAEELWRLDQCRVPLTGKWTGSNPEKILGYESGDLCEFMGWFISEGWGTKHVKTGKKYTFNIAQSSSANPEKCERIKALLDRMGLKSNYAKEGSKAAKAFSISGPSMTEELREELRKQGVCYEKHVPEFLFALSPCLIERFLESMILGDGHCRKRIHQNNSHSSIFTSSPKLADGLQALIQLTGKRGTIQIRDRIGEPVGTGSGGCTQRLQYTVSINRKNQAKITSAAKRSIVQYNDTAFCVTVKNHAIYVRRDGIASWTGNSSHRFPLSEMTIAKQLPLRQKMLYTSKNIVNLIPKKKEMISKTPLVSSHFDYYSKQRTEFQRQIQYSANNQMQDGLCFMKTFFDMGKKKIVHENVLPMFLIVPSDTHSLHEQPWCTHVLQKSEKWLRDRFGETADKSELDSFINSQKTKEGHLSHDSADLEQHKYDRIGISRGKASTNIYVIWERHYRDENTGDLMFTYIAPDRPSLKLCDPAPYYECMTKLDEYVFSYSKYEEISAHIYDTRGIVAKATEWEDLITAMLRGWLNSVQLYSCPMFTAGTPDATPSATQNLDWATGTILPFGLQRVDMGQPPVDFQMVMNFGRETFERWIGQPDYGLGKSNTLGEARTATEVKAISFQQTISTEADISNWKLYIGDIMKRQLGLLNEFKDQIEDWDFMMDEAFQTFDPQFLSDDFEIEVNGSADALNRESQLNNAIALFNLGMQGGPVAKGNIPELFKYVVENATPEQVERFVIVDGQLELETARDAKTDMVHLLQTGSMAPKQDGDPMVKATIAIQQLQKLMASGEGIDQKALMQLGQYISMNRDQLKKTNKQGYEQVTQMMNQLDMASHQALVPQEAPQPQPSPMPV